MKKISIKAAVIAVATISLAACQDAQFHVEGTMAQAKDSMLYLENMGLEGPVAIDSVRLDDGGSFSSSGDAPDAPDFYRLRIDNQIINLSIDSTETVTIEAAYPTMATQYEVKGSENCSKIKELSLKQIDLQQRALAIQKNPTMGLEATRDSIARIVEAYKDDVKRNYIFKEPMKAYAYFALFQALGNQLIFNPHGNKADNQVYAAVATSWDVYYPHAERGQNLHNIAIEGMKNIRLMDAKQKMLVDPNVVNTTNVLDIALVDNKGQVRRLTDLKGKVVLLDFHIFGTEDSPKRIMELREYYNKYHDRGLEIYQVGLDGDEHFWKQQTAALRPRRPRLREHRALQRDEHPDVLPRRPQQLAL